MVAGGAGIFGRGGVAPEGSALQTYGIRMSIIHHGEWTEQEILALESGENDDFDRKSGALLSDKLFRVKLAKALSAFANSSGGHLILGVADDGTIDGVPPMTAKGRTPTREWLEQLVPALTDYPLQDFTVREVVRDPVNSQIPIGVSVIVIDVADSLLAPHQSKEDHVYYSRQSGHSRPAAHHFVDLLRFRPAKATLDSIFSSVEVRGINAFQSNLRIELDLLFTIINESQTVVATHWNLIIDQIEGYLPQYHNCYEFTPMSVLDQIPLLPGMRIGTRQVLAVQVPLSSVQASPAILHEVFAESVKLRHRASSDTWAGTNKLDSILPHIDLAAIKGRAKQMGLMP